MKFGFYLLLFFFPLSFSANAQQYEPGRILAGIEKLGTLNTVLYIAAHPDDENTRLLTWLSKEKGFRTAYLSLTRGDGGQNLVGNELGDMLGVLRTQELLQARKVDGAEQYFTRARDFGYSKNPEETFAIWDKQAVLSDVVWIIRKLKPDVIITRFPATGEGGHGHHTASAILALEAFDAAADPAMFPEQLKEVDVWQSSYLFWNTFNFGGNNTTSEDQVKIDVGGYSTLLGKSYGEIAAASRSMHKSQGFGSAASRGTQTEYLKQLKGKPVTGDPFKSIPAGWSRVNATHIDSLVGRAANNFNFRNTSQIIPSLFEIHKAISQLSDNSSDARYWKAIKLAETERLILDAAGIFLRATAEVQSVAPGNTVEVNTEMVVRQPVDVKLLALEYPGADTVAARPLQQDYRYRFERLVTISPETPFSNPYWLRDAGTTGTLSQPANNLRGLAENPPALSGTLQLSVGGTPITIGIPVEYVTVDPVKGEVVVPFEVLPPVSVSLEEQVFIFTEPVPRTFRIVVKAFMDSVQCELNPMADKGWNASIHPADQKFVIRRKGEERVINVIVVPEKKAPSASLTVSVKVNGKEYNQTVSRVQYDHVPEQVVLSPASARLVYVDLKKGRREIGYIQGAGDALPDLLTQAGYRVTMIDEQMLSFQDISRFAAIVTGIRAFNTNPWLMTYSGRLLEYVKQGGNLIVQYNTNNRIAPLETSFAPYPFTITRNRVTDENATVAFIDKNEPVLKQPNVITSTDFEGWVQERGIYFADDIDARYRKIFEMNDPGEEANTGSLIVGSYGKGNFVYTGLAFFRQLPAGVPGAWRLFANLLALPGKDKQE